MIYFNSAALDKKIKYDEKSGDILVKETPPVKYTAIEWGIIQDTVGEITMQIHNVKKVFKGEIILREE